MCYLCCHVAPSCHVLSFYHVLPFLPCVSIPAIGHLSSGGLHVLPCVTPTIIWLGWVGFGLSYLSCHVLHFLSWVALLGIDYKSCNVLPSYVLCYISCHVLVFWSCATLCCQALLFLPGFGWAVLCWVVLPFISCVTFPAIDYPSCDESHILPCYISYDCLPCCHVLPFLPCVSLRVMCHPACNGLTVLPCVSCSCHMLPVLPCVTLPATC